MPPPGIAPGLPAPQAGVLLLYYSGECCAILECRTNEIKKYPATKKSWKGFVVTSFFFGYLKVSETPAAPGSTAIPGPR